MDINMFINNKVLSLELEGCDSDYDELSLLREILEDFKPQIIKAFNDNMSNRLTTRPYHSFGKLD